MYNIIIPIIVLCVLLIPQKLLNIIFCAGIVIVCVYYYYTIKYISGVKKLTKKFNHIDKIYVRVNSLQQFENFNPDKYLKKDIYYNSEKYKKLLSKIEENENILKSEHLQDALDNLDTKFVMRKIINDCKTSFMEYTRLILIWEYTSPAGKNSYKRANAYVPSFFDDELFNNEGSNFDEFITANQFNRNWLSSNSGYQKIHIPGCYIILLSKNQITNDRDFDDVYVGQSTDVYKRVHNHLMGKGNGDVYADIKYGRYAYIKIIPCAEQNLNEMEKNLIEFYNATDSYNKTSGGGKIR